MEIAAFHKKIVKSRKSSLREVGKREIFMLSLKEALLTTNNYAYHLMLLRDDLKAYLFNGQCMSYILSENLLAINDDNIEEYNEEYNDYLHCTLAHWRNLTYVIFAIKDIVLDKLGNAIGYHTNGNVYHVAYNICGITMHSKVMSQPPSDLISLGNLTPKKTIDVDQSMIAAYNAIVTICDALSIQDLHCDVPYASLIWYDEKHIIDEEYDISHIDRYTRDMCGNGFMDWLQHISSMCCTV